MDKIEIHYPKTAEEIPRDRREELEKEIKHFLGFSPCQRLAYVEKEWAALQKYIKKFGAVWNQKSN